MNNRFSTEDELLTFLKSRVVENKNKDGDVYYSIEDFDELQRKLDEEGKKTKAQRKLKQSERDRVAELESEIAELKEINEVLQSKNPDQLQFKIDEQARTLTKNAKTIEELTRKNIAYEERERQTYIENALVAEARRRGCVETAYDDVKLRWNEYKLEDGEVVGRDGRSLQEAFGEYYEKATHIHPRSTGGGAQGSSASNAKPEDAANAAYEKAKENGDYKSMLAAQFSQAFQN